MEELGLFEVVILRGKSPPTAAHGCSLPSLRGHPATPPLYSCGEDIDFQNKSACVPVRDADRISCDLFTSSIIIRRLFPYPAH